jgi:hypothetical protein
LQAATAITSKAKPARNERAKLFPVRGKQDLDRIIPISSDNDPTQVTLLGLADNLKPGIRQLRPDFFM